MSLVSLCVPETFGSLDLFGASILRVETTVVSGYNQTVPTFRHTPGTEFLVVSAPYCNVTVTYTHPGQNDKIGVETWLPAPEKWNGRFMGTGGGGVEAGRNQGFYLLQMMPAIDMGFAAASTDAGLTADAADWALVSKGNPNQVAHNNFAARSLEEQALIGKAVVKLAYKKPAAFSYFGGCSQGGRQAIMLATRYPTLYDGIAANAPALDVNDIVSNWIRLPLVLKLAGENAPHECEIDAVTAAAVAACDELDGVKDSHVSVAAEECLAHFDPFSVVGRTINCTANLHPDSGDVGQTLIVGKMAAEIASAAWRGPYWSSGPKKFSGLNPGADLTGNSATWADRRAGSLLNTACSNGTGGEVCVGRVAALGETWIKYMTGRDPSRNFSSLTTWEEFESLRLYGDEEYRYYFPRLDLSRFHKAGGRMLSYHGVLDAGIPLRATETAFKTVASRSDKIQDYWRFFPVAGLYHCQSGWGSPPYAMTEQLMAWVENGTAPASSPFDYLDGATGEVHQRLACPFPQKPELKRECGDPKKEACWSCAGDLGAL